MTHPYFPLTPNSWVEYQFCRFDGGYHDAAMTIYTTNFWADIPPWANAARFRMTCLQDQNTQIPMTMRVDTDAGCAPTPGMSHAGKALYNGLWDGPGCPAFVGEYGGVGAVVQPPEPVITAAPIAGETFDVACAVTLYPPNVPSVQQGILNCRYRTIWVGQPYGAEPDTVLTALEERYDTPYAEGNWLYNYLYKPGVGLIDATWGRKLPNGTIKDGYKFYMVGHS